MVISIEETKDAQDLERYRLMKTLKRPSEFVPTQGFGAGKQIEPSKLNVAPNKRCLNLQRWRCQAVLSSSAKALRHR